MVAAENRTGLYVAVPVYFAILAGIALFGYRRTHALVGSGSGEKAGSAGGTTTLLSAHYLGGRTFGPILTSGTLFATIFSGYTVVGIPSEAFLGGWTSLRWFGTGIGIFTSFLLCTMRLREWSVLRNHYTSVDFITDRFRSNILRYVIMICQLIPSLIYLAAQVISIRDTFNSIFELDVDSKWGTIVIFIVILVVEWMGGIIAVASTDMIQGLVMVLSSIMLPIVIHRNFGGWNTLDPLTYPRPDLYLNPTAKTQWSMWNFAILNASYFTLPISIQRTYAVRSYKAFKWGLAVCIIGMWLAWFPGMYLGTMGIQILNDEGIIPTSPFANIVEVTMNLGGFPLVVGTIAFTASLAAIMSTADSLLISVNQLITSELVSPLIPNASPFTLTMFGRLISAITVALGLLIGFLWDEGLNDLIGIQGGLSLQCLPTFFVGLFAFGPTDCHPWSLATGSLIGCVLTVSLFFGYIKKNDDPIPMDAGVTSCFFNVISVILIEIIRRFTVGDWCLRTTTPTNNNDKTKQEYNNDHVDDEVVLFDARPNWDKPNTAERFARCPLTSRLLWKATEGIWEPCKDPSIIFLLFLFTVILIPIIPEENVSTMLSVMMNGQYAPPTIMGIPYWAFKMLITALVATIIMFAALYAAPCTLSNVQNLPKGAAADSAQQEQAAAVAMSHSSANNDESIKNVVVVDSDDDDVQKNKDDDAEFVTAKQDYI